MKESPIIFNEEMVLAILDGRKTQTRRIIKPSRGQEWLSDELLQSSKPSVLTPSHVTKPSNDYGVQLLHPNGGPLGWVKFPFGQIGDQLWVKETWHGGDDTLENVFYKASDRCFLKYGVCQCSWRPSIFMPRKFSRITLQITNVRVQKLQDITEADCHKEGVEGHGVSPMSIDQIPVAIANFKALWNSIYGQFEFAWSKNPWVWVIEFKRV